MIGRQQEMEELRLLKLRWLGGWSGAPRLISELTPDFIDFASIQVALQGIRAVDMDRQVYKLTPPLPRK